MPKTYNVAILAGGTSAERPISLQTGSQIASWCEGSEFRPFLIDVQGVSWLYADAEGQHFSMDLNTMSLPLPGATVRFDVAFLATHGTPCENGLLQGLLDLHALPYTTGGTLAQSLSFHKGACKRFLAGEVPMAESVEITTPVRADLEAVCEELGYPLFVKPTDNGSSVGVRAVHSADELGPAVEFALENGYSVLLERAIRGTEVSCGMVCLEGEDTVFPITELVSPAEFFDYQTKYDGTTQEITPARIPDSVAREIGEYTRRVYHLLGLRGLARADYIIENGTPYFLEINTIPGMTSHSIIPQQVRAHGWSMESLLPRLLREAMARFEEAILCS